MMQPWRVQLDDLMQSHRTPAELEAGLMGLRDVHGPKVFYLAGEWLLSRGALVNAREWLGRACNEMPNDVLAAHNHAECMRLLGLHEEASIEFDRAIKIQSDFMPSRLALADTLELLVFQRKAAGKPEFSAATARGLANLLNETGCHLMAKGQEFAAWDYFKRALQFNDQSPGVHANLGNVLRLDGRLGEAEFHCRKSIELNPDLASGWNNLGNVLSDLGHYQEADACFDRALALDPDLTVAHQNKVSGQLFNELHSSRLSDEEVFELHRQWGQGLPKCEPQHGALRWQPGTPVRIAYLSADFRSHAMRHYLEPILTAHNTSEFKVYCYSQSPVVDEHTRRLMALGHEWVSIHSLSDDALVQRILDDQIHVLVDCLGHTHGSRLYALAKKPAPIQLAYLGYLGTTGLKAMDYKLTDEWLDPSGLTDSHHVEKLLRLPGGCAVYTPHLNSPPVAPLPALKNGHVTFGSMNKLRKLNPEVVRVWAQVLHACPGSRLLIKTKDLADPFCKGRVTGWFDALGVGPERLVLQRADAKFLDTYGDIDIALDPFPFGGGATTCDALWMGVPVITMPGSRTAGRLTCSILNTMGKGAWIANSKDEYVQKAAALAHDTQALSTIRAHLREHMQQSRLMRADQFMAAYEPLLKNLVSGL